VFDDALDDRDDHVADDCIASLKESWSANRSRELLSRQARCPPRGGILEARLRGLVRPSIVKAAIAMPIVTGPVRAAARATTGCRAGAGGATESRDDEDDVPRKGPPSRSEASWSPGMRGRCDPVFILQGERARP